MEAFSTLLAICTGNSPVTGEFPTQRPLPLRFDIFFDLRLNKWLSKQSGGWWFETPSRPLWRYSNGFHVMPHDRLPFSISFEIISCIFVILMKFWLNLQMRFYFFTRVRPHTKLVFPENISYVPQMLPRLRLNLFGQVRIITNVIDYAP